MDNPGALQIYAHDNVAVPEFSAIADKLHDLPPSIPHLNEDDINIRAASTRRTSSGRRSRKHTNPDEVYF